MCNIYWQYIFFRWIFEIKNSVSVNHGNMQALPTKLYNVVNGWSMVEAEWGLF